YNLKFFRLGFNSGHNCVVTGANSGIGYVVAEALASSGGNVYMVCRNKERGEATVSKVQSATGNQNVYLETGDELCRKCSRNFLYNIVDVAISGENNT
ncbi:hypothetical protein MKW98_022661, partial [Papaver atlanticum]